MCTRKETGNLRAVLLSSAPCVDIGNGEAHQCSCQYNTYTAEKPFFVCNYPIPHDEPSQL